MIYDEGYIKFNLSWKEKPFNFSDDAFVYLNTYRKKLFDLGLIGLYPDGIGFGNISIRHRHNQFIISGSATGGIQELSKEHYALVTEFNIPKNHVTSEGLTKASSESLSHGTIYASNSKVHAVIHVHHCKLWEKYLNTLPTTDEKVAFGTPEIAIEIGKLANNDSGIIMMGGHPEGIISYGESLETAYNLLLKYFKKI